MVAMANPQREHGFTGIANELLEAIVAAPLSGGQTRLLLHLIRQSYGYNTTKAELSATAFATATKLHPKVVAREMRDLEARQYVIAFKTEGRATVYKVQKDYTRWDTGNVSVPGNEKVPGHQMVPGTGNVSVLDRERKGSPPTIEKEIPKEKKEKTTEPHGSGASPAPARIGTLRQQFEEDYRAATDKSKRIGVAGVYFGKMLGPPNYGRIGELLSQAKSGGAFFAALAEAAKQTITDDPHDYVAAILKRGPATSKPDRQSNGFFANYGHLLSKDDDDGPGNFPDALDVAFVVGPAHRRQQ